MLARVWSTKEFPPCSHEKATLRTWRKRRTRRITLLSRQFGGPHTGMPASTPSELRTHTTPPRAAVACTSLYPLLVGRGQTLQTRDSEQRARSESPVLPGSLTRLWADDAAQTDIESGVATMLYNHHTPAAAATRDCGRLASGCHAECAAAELGLDLLQRHPGEPRHGRSCVVACRALSLSHGAQHGIPPRRGRKVAYGDTFKHTCWHC